MITTKVRKTIEKVEEIYINRYRNGIIVTGRGLKLREIIRENSIGEFQEIICKCPL